MDKNSILAFNNKESVPDVLNALLREGAQQLIHRAVESELSEYLSQHQHFTADGRIAVVLNGYLPKREILTGIGPVSVRIPKVRSRDGEPLTFRSALVPPYVRKTRSLEAALPWLYLKGVSTGEMGEALKVLVGHDAQGLSASTVSRLKSEFGHMSTNIGVRNLLMRIAGYISGQTASIQVFALRKTNFAHWLSLESTREDRNNSWPSKMV